MVRIALILLLICSVAQAATLTDIRVASYPKKIRVVFDFDQPVFHGITTTEGALGLALISCEAQITVPPVKEVNDWVVRKIEVGKLNGNLTINIPLEYPVRYNIFPLGGPDRLVIDFNRTFTKIAWGGKLSEGVEYFGVIKGGEEGYQTAEILKVDPKKAEVVPTLAKTPAGWLGSITDFFNPWAKKKRPTFARSKVTEILSQQNGLAAVNGTYFSSRGEPLGVLMIGGEIVSYPISDRTALVITKDRDVFIDNIILDSYIEVNGHEYEISGINEARSSAQDVILYTRYYDETTGTNNTGYEFTVENARITDIRVGNSRVPEEGFVVSAGSLYAEHLNETIKKGAPVKAMIDVIPYSSSTKGRLMHLIGGGPRLLKGGRIYISKIEEKFRSDIAKGRAARTAVGITEDGKLLLVTVDGRPRGRRANGSDSIGMSLTELAYFLQSLGAKEALNLDGGGSSTMVVRGKVMNQPAGGSQRRVSNAVVISGR